MTQFVLSLFPGIGLLDSAFESEGFCLVKGPDLLWNSDVRRFHPPANTFTGVLGGPPCQTHTALAHLNRAQGVEPKHGDMNSEFARVVFEAQPNWFLRENAPQSGSAEVDGYITHSQLIRDVWVGGETRRERRICFGTRDGRRLNVETLALHSQNAERAVTGDAREASVGERLRKKASGASIPLAEMLRLQGFPPDFFGEDCPFTKKAKRQMIGNGVPWAMGVALARAVKKAMGDSKAKVM